MKKGRTRSLACAFPASREYCKIGLIFPVIREYHLLELKFPVIRKPHEAAHNMMTMTSSPVTFQATQLMASCMSHMQGAADLTDQVDECGDSCETLRAMSTRMEEPLSSRQQAVTRPTSSPCDAQLTHSLITHMDAATTLTPPPAPELFSAPTSTGAAVVLHQSNIEGVMVVCQLTQMLLVPEAEPVSWLTIEQAQQVQPTAPSQCNLERRTSQP